MPHTTIRPFQAQPPAAREVPSPGHARGARSVRMSSIPGLAAMAGLVGRTPMLAIDLRVRGQRRRVHAKAE